MKNYKNIIIALVALLIPVWGGAQISSFFAVASGASKMELTKAKSLWFNSNNAAGLFVTPLNNFNEVSLNYSLNSGNFKMQQQGDKESNISFNTNGAYRMGDYSLWGNFSFNNQTINDSRFNTTMCSPLRDMPYIVADPVLSKWKQQSYELNFKGASPIYWDLISFGLSADYFANTGAKQNDPRSTNYNYNISVKPGLMFSIAKKHNIGLNFIYNNGFERTVPTNSNNQEDQQVFIMKGLGNYTPGVVGGKGGISTFFYKANLVGGAIQYGINGKFSLLAEGRYHYKVEDAYQTTSKPERMGTVVQKYINAKLQLMLDGTYTNKLSIAYSDKSSDGIEYVQVIDKSADVQNWVTLAKYIRSNYRLKQANLQYDIFKSRDKGYSWRAGIVGDYSDRLDQYYLPSSTLKAKNIFYGAFAKKDFSLCLKSNLLVGLNLGYNSNISGEYVYNGADPKSIIVQELFIKDAAFLTSSFLKAGAELNFSTLVYKKMALFVKAETTYLKPSKGDFNRKLFANLVVGLTF